MKLVSPERTAEGFRLSCSEPGSTPSLAFDTLKWVVTTEWMRATDVLRTKVLAALFEARSTLFKTSPSQKTLELLLSPWVVIDDDGSYRINCELPLPTSTKAGLGSIELTGILIKRDGILPIWTLKSYAENTPVVDFDWDEAPAETELREVTLFETAAVTDDSQVMQLRTDDEYNTRKFAAKERVKEARLKAILARRAAEVETTRYYNEFNFGDNESTFSEYDISDMDEDEPEEGD
jgi:hypothetical protein